jgi:hypothetical protein
MENTKGRVFYRVATVNSDGTPGPFSAPVPFWIPSEILRPAKSRTAAKPKQNPTTASAVSTAAAPALPSKPVGPEWSIRPAAEFSSWTETSDFSQLRRVETDGAFLHEALEVSRIAPRSRIGLELRAKRFESGSGALSKTRSFGADLSFERKTSLLDGRLLVGAVADLSGRFEKADSETLRLSRGLSLGPSATFSDSGWTIALRLPVTGLLLDGFFGGAYGPVLLAERDFGIGSIGSGEDRIPISISVSASGAYRLFDDPSGASVLEGSVGIGPKVILR